MNRASSSGLPKASRLEQLVADYLHRAAPAPLQTASGQVPQLTPRAFQDIITAFLLHEGERYWLSGAVLRQRGISVAEAGALLSDCGVGARFLLEPARSGEPFYLTVYSVLSAHTRALQERLGQGTPMTMVVRVLSASPAAEFPGFAMYGSQTRHPWTLVIDELVKP